MKECDFIGGGDAATMGIGATTDARWKKTDDFMVNAGLLKSGVDWRRAYITRFVKEMIVMP
jgi:NitT/TauT family transport system substrate-binding protein